MEPRHRDETDRDRRGEQESRVPVVRGEDTEHFVAREDGDRNEQRDEHRGFWAFVGISITPIARAGRAMESIVPSHLAPNFWFQLFIVLALLDIGGEFAQRILLRLGIVQDFIVKCGVSTNWEIPLFKRLPEP
jgi:hypothetical protein